MSCDECHSPQDCDCTAGCGAPATLAPPANPAGRSAVRTRIGDYSAFFADALRRLNSADAPALRALGTRAASDPTVALLDAWSVAADVLTFYRERLSNEGYLRTARGATALRDLAAGVGFQPRPGVAASVHLAFLLDANAAPVDIPAGARTQTIPRPGEQMQTFETDEPLLARAEWSAMTPRLTRVPAIDRVAALTSRECRLNDASLMVRPGERLLFRFGDKSAQQVVREVASARNDVQNGCVVLTLKPRPGLHPALAGELLKVIDELVTEVGTASGNDRPILTELLEALVSYLLGASALDALGGVGQTSTLDALGGGGKASALCAKRAAHFLAALLQPEPETPIDIKALDIDGSLAALQRTGAAQPAAGRYLQREAAARLDASGAMRGALLQALTPNLATHLYAAWRDLPGTPATPAVAPTLYLLRTVASPYGANAPLQTAIVRNAEADWAMSELDQSFAYLDTVNDAISPGSFALVQTPRVENASSHTVRFARVIGAGTAQRGDYSQNSKVTRLELADPATGALLKVLHGDPGRLATLGSRIGYLRNAVFAVQSEQVTLAPEPIADDVLGESIMLAGLYEGLEVGRKIIVAGERTDVLADGAPLAGIRDGELAMVKSITQVGDPASPGDRRRTVIGLHAPLAFKYRRSSVLIYANVVLASHGETVSEVLGSGDAQERLASYGFKRTPLTFVSAPTPVSVAGSQIVRVNDVRWREVDSLLDAGPADRVYELASDQNGGATVTFGDGMHGARLPSGQDNLRVQYRVGIGRAGNVQPGQITLLSTRPLGVQGVINPLRGSGGADPDGMEQIRRNVPHGVLALAPRSRLVSVRDYAYFAQRFAAIGLAQATRLADAGAGVVYLTVAGVDDIPLDPDGALLASLANALHTYGDPALAVLLGVRELIALVLQARVAIDADADWNVVEPGLRARLLERFSFQRADLGRPVYLSQAIAALQATPGVAWVDVDVFGGISELQLRDKAALEVAVGRLQEQAAGGAVQTVVRCAPAMAAADAPEERRELARKLAGTLPRFLPAQLALLAPDVPGTVVLNLVEPRSNPC